MAGSRNLLFCPFFCVPAIVFIRYAFSIAELSWLEKKGAATLGAELPPLTHSDALQYFLEAERLVERENKEYMLMIAKCYIALKDYKTAVEWLTKANAISTNGNIVSTNSLPTKQILCFILFLGRRRG